MNFKKYFTFPLTTFSTKCSTADGNMAFDFPMKLLYPYSKQFTDDEKQEIIDILNGNGKHIEIEEGFLKYISESTTIYLFKNEIAIPFIIIRGWGHLTGKGGGLGLEFEQASEIQDAFAEYIVKTLIKQ